jgi:enoyl reductase-like protein
LEGSDGSAPQVDQANRSALQEWGSQRDRAVKKIGAISRPKTKAPISRQRISGKTANAAAEHLRTVDIVLWLADHPSDLDLIQELASLVQNQCETVLKDFEKSKRTRLADSHFWCDVLAAMVSLVDNLQEAVKKAKKGVPGAIGQAALEV